MAPTTAGSPPADWPPIALDPVTPAELRSWLDAAGISYRVVSVSACYSGSWIAPLAGPNTLVMTASDAEHTSYGCGRRSELTYFGRALYDEQLRHHTLSFERAMAAARPLIEQREIEAGKSDGYSNPQIALGDAGTRPTAAAAASARRKCDALRRTRCRSLQSIAMSIKSDKWIRRMAESTA